MKFIDTEMELLLAPKNEIVDEESEGVKAKRKEIQKIVDKKHQGMDYLTLGKNGLIPNGIRTEEKMKEYENTVEKQDEAESFALEFNSWTKKKRKELTIPDIRERLNGGMDLSYSDCGIHIRVASELTLQSIPEILKTLDVLIADNKVVENKYIKIMYEPIMDYKKHLIEDVQIIIFVTNEGMYQLNYKWWF